MDHWKAHQVGVTPWNDKNLKYLDFYHVFRQRQYIWQQVISQIEFDRGSGGSHFPLKNQDIMNFWN